MANICNSNIYIKKKKLNQPNENGMKGPTII